MGLDENYLENNYYSKLHTLHVGLDSKSFALIVEIRTCNNFFHAASPSGVKFSPNAPFK